jgi:hypothetical protein
MASFKSALCLALLPAVSANECSATPVMKFFTTGEPGDHEGYECLACPTQPVLDYIQNPNDHFDTLSEAEQYVLQYWAAMSRGDTDWMLANYAKSGMLTRAGGPSVGGNRYTSYGERHHWDPFAEYEPQSDSGGMNYWWYAQFVDRVTWTGHSNDTKHYSTKFGTGGLHVAIQDTVQVSDDFALVTAIINGTQYDRDAATLTANEGIVADWQSGKATISVRKFPGIGWKIVQFTCSFLSFSWFPEGMHCMPGASSGVPPPHTDWTADYEYAVKHTDMANYCSKKCRCGEAPAAKPAKPCPSLPSTLPYQNNLFVTEETGLQPKDQQSKCQPCPVAGFTPTFPKDSAEEFGFNYIKMLAAGSEDVLPMYSDHAVIIRNGGPMITGPSGNGGEFFTKIWPGLTFVGNGGAHKDIAATLHRSQRLGDLSAQMIYFTNGTLYDSKTGDVSVPWLAKKIVLTVANEDSVWKIVNVALMDFNTNGVPRCTSDGTFLPYCFKVCPCGEVEIVDPADATVEGTVYHMAQKPAAMPPSKPQMPQQAQLRQRTPLRRKTRRAAEGDVSSMMQMPEGLEEEDMEGEEL